MHESNSILDIAGLEESDFKASFEESFASQNLDHVEGALSPLFEQAGPLAASTPLLTQGAGLAAGQAAATSQTLGVSGVGKIAALGLAKTVGLTLVTLSAMGVGWLAFSNEEKADASIEHRVAEHVSPLEARAPAEGIRSALDVQKDALAKVKAKDALRLGSADKTSKKTQDIAQKSSTKGREKTTVRQSSGQRTQAVQKVSQKHNSLTASKELKSDARVRESQQAQNKGSNSTQRSTQRSAQNSAMNRVALTLFEQASALFDAKDYGKADLKFLDFLKKYPQNTLGHEARLYRFDIALRKHFYKDVVSQGVRVLRDETSEKRRRHIAVEVLKAASRTKGCDDTIFNLRTVGIDIASLSQNACEKR